MQVNKTIEAIELLNKNFICLFKIGAFYHVYGKDAYILSYLCHYKINLIKYEAGFPINNLNKVIATLENENINYLVFDSRNGYELDTKQDFKSANRYEKVYNKAREYVNMQARIENIHLQLLNMSTKKGIRKILGKIEEIINEKGEVSGSSEN